MLLVKFVKVRCRLEKLMFYNMHLDVIPLVFLRLGPCYNRLCPSSISHTLLNFILITSLTVHMTFFTATHPLRSVRFAVCSADCSRARHIWWSKQLRRWSQHPRQRRWLGRTGRISPGRRQGLVRPRLCWSCGYTGPGRLWVALKTQQF